MRVVVVRESMSREEDNKLFFPGSMRMYAETWVRLQDAVQARDVNLATAIAVAEMTNCMLAGEGKKTWTTEQRYSFAQMLADVMAGFGGSQDEINEIVEYYEGIEAELPAE